jgi:hypothetical protein
MSAEVLSQAGFAFGRYLQSVRPVPAPSELVVSRRSFVASRIVSRALHQLGCALEDRTIAAIGARIGVFPVDDVADWLAVGDTKIRTIRESGDLGEVWNRLPALLSTSDLLETSTSIGADSRPQTSEADDFRSFLRFRGCFDGAELSEFMTELLFSTEEQWEHAVTEAAAQAERAWWNHGPPGVFGIFDAVRTATDVLAWKIGGTINESDPWGVTRGLPYSGPLIRFEYLRKTDAGTPRMVKQILAEAVSGSADFGDTYNVLDEVILLKVLQFARLPQYLDPRSEQRRPIVEVITPSDETQLALRLGMGFIWAAALWRLAPADQRSQSRAMQATDVMKQAIYHLLRNTDEFLVADRMVFYPSRSQ